ncbi:MULTISPECIES: peptidylprolyl isomerase [Segatella]|jgi:peptidyl-prolyl cis-trans isomerase B (cyclophilin B)|uniref:peptidylprolyl isomerase n=2 Tax=Segatella TaxID=2974251 RepID=D8DZ00_9BACT|nr:MULTISPECIES: peptidylprolyl isomerase [Segatella]MBQ3857848.1 peptidylprolyl isomerase [Prevotella sp.]EFI71324.1 peptidyl-prolyl cis-trans isomerase, cyclophilin-type [Segatella baroniae B14]MDR4930874.1 peptidylprolyl isomerase [Segatella bryantii]UKK73628.1 peptidylprolyl isomerase [Segatella bryantii]UKK77010.1 peptidylprolyl isomerase [Segatella bryantii]
MKKFILALGLLLVQLSVYSQSVKRTEVLLQTSMGNVRIQLYNETPKHRDNFLKIVNSKQMDGMLFHRVVKDFMIQTGDPDSRKAKPGQVLGNHQIGKDFPAEIIYPQFFHKRGALAAARQPDNENPDKKSSGSQFYIVWGKKFSEHQLNFYQSVIDTVTNFKVKFTPEIRKVYQEVGGTPFLDGQYTVFGEVTEGLEVIDRIQQVEVDAWSRPKEDVKIIKAYVVK